MLFKFFPIASVIYFLPVFDRRYLVALAFTGTLPMFQPIDGAAALYTCVQCWAWGEMVRVSRR